jgi:DNA-binding MarR family transcriptional regulator
MPLISSLTDHDGYWLRMVSNAISHEFARKVATEGVTVAEWAVLRVLYDVDQMAPSSLAERMRMTKGAISKLAERLLEKELIQRTESRTDKRTHRLSLSKAGRQKVPVLSKLADKNDAEYFGVLTAEERNALSRVLRVLVERHGLSNVPVE